MKYCLFCRDSFEDEVEACPYCGGELAGELPDDAEGVGAREDESPSGAGLEEEHLLQVAIITSEEDLTAAVEVLRDENVYFEIDEVERTKARAGVIPGRAWRLLVEAEEAHEAFLSLVKRIPRAFPRPVGQAEGGQARENDRTEDVPSRVEEILDSADPGAASAELARAVVHVFCSDDAAAIARSMRALARRGGEVGGLLARIAVESARSGGEGAERVLFHSMKVLEAIGHDEALPEIEALYSSPVPQVRSRASYAAGRLGNPEAVDALLDLEDEDEDVRYEASEAVWRLTGLDFEFEPYAPLEEERENVHRLRETWRQAGTKIRVRGRITLADLFRGFQGR